MRRRQRLNALLGSFAKNVARHRRTFVEAAGLPGPRQKSQLVGAASIEVHNSWSNFVRAYYLSCVMSARAISGESVTCVDMFVRSDPIGYAVHLFNPKACPTSEGNWRHRTEPPWHDPYVLTTLATVLPLSNEADVRAAFSIGSRVFIDLPVFRNYFAHRNQASERAARDLAILNSIPGQPSPAEILIATPLSRPQSLFLDWLDDLMFTASYLCD